MKRVCLASSLASLFLVLSLHDAQAAGARTRKATPTPMRSPSPVLAAAPPPPADGDLADGELEPAAAPPVSDPLLAPIAAAPREISQWAEMATALERRGTDLRVALTDVRRAEGQWRQALAATLPNLAGQAAATHQIFSNVYASQGGTVRVPTIDTVQGSLVVTQPLFDFAAWQAVGTASVDEDVARLGVTETKRRVTQSAITAAFAVVAADRVATLNRSSLRAALERASLAERRARLSAGTSLDVARAHLDTNAVRTQLINGDEAARQAREALGLALGISQATGVEGEALKGIVRDLESACPALPRTLDRADIAVERRRLDAAERRASNAYQRLLPTLTARADASLTSDSSTLAPPALASVQGILSIPIWDGGALYGARRAAEASVDAAHEQILARERAVTIEVAQTERAITVADARLAVATTTRDEARTQDRLQRIAFAQGRSTSLELVVAGAALRDAETALILRDLELLSARTLARLSRAQCRW